MILGGSDAEAMQFYFIRHAQSQNNQLWEMTGSSRGRSDDPALSETGTRQAQMLAQFLCQGDGAFLPGGRDDHNRAGFRLTHLYTSLMLRAVATASVVADALDLPLVAREELHESGGIYLEDEATGERRGQSGKSRAFFLEHYPRLVLPPTCGEHGWWNRPFEERERAMQRAVHFWQGMIERHGSTQDRVAVVSHGDFYNCLLKSVLRMDGSESWFDLNNAGITRIDLDEGFVHLVYANRTDFLPRELIT